MTKDSGVLSIDFIVGFTIFLIAFIWVLSMIPGLLIGLQGYTIDYDAVAYRTGVILVEDPGWPASPPWESQQNFSVTRFGLAVSRDTPNILSQEKINRFFCTTSVYGAFAYPEDYHQRVIFGDYPYRFNISLIDVGGNRIQSVGDVVPEGFGYIRRIVKIKGISNATINESYILSHPYINSDNVTTHEFSILVNNSGLTAQKNPAYEIDPARDQIMVNITDLRSTIKNTTIPVNSINVTLTKINVYKVDSGILSLVRTFNTPYIDDNSSTTQPPCEVNNSVSLKFSPAFFEILNAGSSPVYVNLSFNLSSKIAGIPTPYPSRFLNNTWSSPFDYDYNPAHVTQPQLRDAMVEVAVW